MAGRNNDFFDQCDIVLNIFNVQDLRHDLLLYDSVCQMTQKPLNLSTHLFKFVRLSVERRTKNILYDYAATMTRFLPDIFASPKAFSAASTSCCVVCPCLG